MNTDGTGNRKVKIADLRDKFLAYDALERHDRSTAQERGRKVEKMVRDVFLAWRLLRREGYHTNDNRLEQIDGVVELDGRLALLEVKCFPLEHLKWVVHSNADK